MPNLYIISGPSGVGKGTIIREVIHRVDSIKLAVSATTRQPRAGEVNTQHYYFLSDAEFSRFVDSGEFVEWCQVFDNRYGTLRKEVDQIKASGYDALLEIDVQGAQKVKQAVPDAICIFIAPPSESVLKERLIKRATEDEHVMNRRLKVAQNELAAQEQYDFIVINDTQEHAVQEVIDILERCSTQIESTKENSHG